MVNESRIFRFWLELLLKVKRNGIVFVCCDFKVFNMMIAYKILLLDLKQCKMHVR